MKKAGRGLIRDGIKLVMSQEAPMQPASKSEAANANYANPSSGEAVASEPQDDKGAGCSQKNRERTDLTKVALSPPPCSPRRALSPMQRVLSYLGIHQCGSDRRE